MGFSTGNAITTQQVTQISLSSRGCGAVENPCPASPSHCPATTSRRRALWERAVGNSAVLHRLHIPTPAPGYPHVLHALSTARFHIPVTTDIGGVTIPRPSQRSREVTRLDTTRLPRISFRPCPVSVACLPTPRDQKRGGRRRSECATGTRANTRPPRCLSRTRVKTVSAGMSGSGPPAGGSRCRRPCPLPPCRWSGSPCCGRARRTACRSPPAAGRTARG